MFRINYGEYIFQQLITSAFVQKKLTQILISLIANIIQLHIVSVLCIITSIHPYLDFIVQIGLSVFMTLHIHLIYNALARYDREFLVVTQYLINNYSAENYRYWKRVVVLSVCAYASLILLVVELTNSLVLLYIGQYVICYILVDQFEQQRIQKWIQEIKERPSVIKSQEDVTLIESYMSPKKHVLREPVHKNNDHEFVVVPEKRRQRLSRSEPRLSNQASKGIDRKLV